MAIYPTEREKYEGRANAMSSEAYVLDLPERLGVLARIEEKGLGKLDIIPKKSLALMDFVELSHRSHLMRAMRHNLFRSTSRLTQLVHQRAQHEVQ